MRRKPNPVVLLVAVSLALVSSLAVSGLLTTQKIMSSTGSVRSINVEVYWNMECTQIVNSINWGTPEPGDLVSKTVYIKNTGTVQMTLSMHCSGWNPQGVENYLTLSWDREGAQVNAGEVIPAILTLSVSGSITGITNFSFNIVLAGTG